MGNLEVSNRERSPFPRKPIFNHDNTAYHKQASRSLSPFLLKTSRSNIYKSSIANQSFRYANQSQRNSSANRLYLSPAMVKSVIKDSSNSDHLRPNTRLNKSTMNITSQSSQPRNLNRAKQFPRFRKDYHERPFQEQSPNKQIREALQRSREYEESFEKQNINRRRILAPQINMPDMVQEFVISPINKSMNVTKFLRSGNSSTRNYGTDGHLLPQIYHQCCCRHQIFDQKPSGEEDAPTQRKRQPKIQVQSFFQPNKKIKTEIRTTRPTIGTKFTFGAQSKIENQINLHYQNRQKCKDIIKRVRNFNEFLNEIKDKIKTQYSNLNSSSNTIANASISENEQQSFNSPTVSMAQPRHENSMGTELSESKVNPPKSITLALRLQNQRIQLQKYRKLVERELSKQHSIESIEIQEKNKQKLITINFDHQKISHKTNETKNTIKRQETKTTFKKIKKNQKIVQRQQKEPLNIKNRVKEINNLFNKVQGMNKAQIESHREVFQMLKVQEDGDQI